MKLIRHHEAVVAIFERAWEKAYVLAHQSLQEWIPLALPGQAQRWAEIHATTRSVRLCEGSFVLTEQPVVFQDLGERNLTHY